MSPLPLQELKDTSQGLGTEEHNIETVGQEDSHRLEQPLGGEEIYNGHGEWVKIDREVSPGPQIDLAKEGKDSIRWIRRLDRDLDLHYLIWEKGYPNRYGAKIPLETKWNLQKMEELLIDYEDREVVQWMKYGWPTGKVPGTQSPYIWTKNHKGAEDHPAALRQYIQKELNQGAIMGPYPRIPFRDRVGISPLSTHPKKASHERRIILDLSFPIGQGINDSIPKDTYMGLQAKLSFPKTDDFAKCIFQLGEDCVMFKIDLSRYFRQLPLDPGDYSLIGYVVEEKIYFDKVLPMGMRSAPYITQRVTNAIAHIHRQMGFFLLNYVDDFVGAETKEKIWKAYNSLTILLKELGVETSKEKIVEPTTRMEFLGITFDAEQKTMEIPQEKLQEIMEELNSWLYKVSASRKEIESLIGKLQFAAKCVRMGRIFIARLINWIRGLSRKGKHRIPLEARKDISWWGRFMQEFNGISILWMVKVPNTDMEIATDASLQGYGGISEQEYFRGKFPQHYKNLNIAILELKAVMVALKHWSKKLTGKYFWIHVDNQAVATILNTGASREETLQDTLREVALLAAKHQFVIKAKHISGVSNRVPDWLSRWHQTEARKEFRLFAQDKSLRRLKSPMEMLKHEHEW